MTTTRKFRAERTGYVSRTLGLSYPPEAGFGPWQLNPVNTTSDQGPIYGTHQLVDSEGHQVSLLGRDHSRDLGGPFLNQKVEILNVEGKSNRVHEAWSDSDGYFTRFAEGIIVPDVAIRDILIRSNPTAAQIQALCPVPVADIVLDSYGATAISRCAPTNPLADAAATIGEIREGLPSVPGTSGNIGGEYLNIVFGAAPLISELSAYRSSWSKAEKLLDQLERDAGRLIRRKYSFPDEIVTTTSSNSRSPVVLPSGSAHIDCVRPAGPRVIIETRTTKKWFSGAFTYHLPKSGWRRKLSELDALYGVRPGLDTLWELTPWSWLVDWQSNVGDVLKNLSSFSSDGLIMPYAYVMCQQESHKEYVMPVEINDRGTWRAVTISVAVKAVTQQRRPATPFGFGIQLSQLTTKQGAILAALGISFAR